LYNCLGILKDNYLYEKKLITLETKLKSEASASEIWSDGDLSNSFFDIIVDLNIIEVILFSENSYEFPFSDNYDFSDNSSNNNDSSQNDENNDDDNLISLKVMANDWIEITFKGESDSSYRPFYLTLMSDSSSPFGTSDLGSCYVWGAQLEEGTLGSYIATAGSEAINATLIQNPNDIGKDVLGNSLRLRGDGFNLDGSGYGSIANDTTLQFGTTAFTIQAWIKPSSLITNHRIITKGVTGNGEWMLSIGTNCVRVYSQDSLGNALDTASTFSVLTLDVWQMIIVVIDTPNNQILFYLNDGSVQTKTGAAWTGNFNNTLPITIGNTSSVSSGQFFDGIVDENLIYNRALTPTEILNNYNVGFPTHQN
jgi:hypothetical protein